jgi:dienelactone hydrolase
MTTPLPTSGTGTFHGPATLPVNRSVSVNAVSITDPTKSSSASITLTNGTVQLIPAELSFSCKLTTNVFFHPCPPPTQSVTLTNTGATGLIMTGITTTGPFSQTNNCGNSVLTGAQCSITVTFTSKIVGMHTGTLSFSDSSSDSPQTVNLQGTVTRYGPPIPAKAELTATNSAAVPAPTGNNVVGTRMLELVDSARQDPYLANGSRRELAIRMWYPMSSYSNQQCRPAEYTSSKVWDYFARLLGVTAFQVATNSCQDAEVAGGTHPVILLTPGYTGTFTDYTFLTEDLASRGYIVVAVDHTYEATAVQFSDGRIVQSRVGSHLGGLLPRDHRSLAFAVDARTADLKFVLAEIAKLNSRRGSPFAGRLDLSKIAVAGHSLGGLTALLAGGADPHIKAVILMDPVLPDVLPGRTSKPVLILAADRKQWAATECGLWSNLDGPRLAISLQGTEHVALSDWIWLTKDAVQTGDMGPQRTMSAIRDYVGSFLETNLRGEPANELLAGPSANYPGARITTQEQLLCGTR